MLLKNIQTSWFVLPCFAAFLPNQRAPDDDDEVRIETSKLNQVPAATLR